MAMKDAKIKYLEHELEEKERALDMLRDVDRREADRPAGGGDDGRVSTLERRVRELEAVVKGLTEELLDLKALVLKMAKSFERQEPPAPVRAPPARSAEPPAAAPTILVRPRNAEKLSPSGTPAPARPPAAATPAPAVPPEEMDLIMQPDGTIKPEVRLRNEYIIASNGFQNKRQDRKPGGERSGRHVDAVIFAEEHEPPRPPKKR